MSKTVSAVHERLHSLTGRTRSFDETIGLHRLRLPVPLVRKAVKPDYSFLSSSNEENLRAWSEVWSTSDLFEAKSQALYFYQYKSISRDEFKVISMWVAGCTCWEHSDDLSKIIAGVTEENPEWTLPVLTK